VSSDLTFVYLHKTVNQAAVIREIESSEIPLLEDFLYHALFWPPGFEPQPKEETIYKPEIYIYIKDFGKDGDCAVVAEQGGGVVGAAWTRIISAYGHIDDATPELAISVLPEYRGRGIGASLLNGLFALLRKRGYRQTSLSVQKENPAARLYRRAGYKILHENDEEYIMVKVLR
jgi:ribosomal protein S18 acetylase RimI-like enzyme